MPASAPVCMVIFVWPSCVQIEPSGELKPVNVFPDRTIRTQYGGFGPLIQPVTLIEAAPVPGRTCIDTPLVGVKSTQALIELVASDSRIMTPAFANDAVNCSLTTSAEKS